MKYEIDIVLRSLECHVRIATVIRKVDVVVFRIHKGHAEAVDWGTVNLHLIEHLLLLIIAEIFAF